MVRLTRSGGVAFVIINSSWLFAELQRISSTASPRRLMLNLHFYSFLTFYIRMKLIGNGVHTHTPAQSLLLFFVVLRSFFLGNGLAGWWVDNLPVTVRLMR